MHPGPLWGGGVYLPAKAASFQILKKGLSRVSQRGVLGRRDTVVYDKTTNYSLHPGSRDWGYEWSLTGTQPRPFIRILSTAAVTPQWQNGK